MDMVNSLQHIYKNKPLSLFRPSVLLLLFRLGDVSQMAAQFSSRPAEGVTGWQQWQNQPHTQGTADTHLQSQNNQPEMFQVSEEQTQVESFTVCFTCTPQLSNRIHTWTHSNRFDVRNRKNTEAGVEVKAVT